MIEDEYDEEERGIKNTRKILIVGAGSIGTMCHIDHGASTVITEDNEKLIGNMSELFSMKNKEVQQRLAITEIDYLGSPKSGQEKRRERRKKKK